MATSVPRTNGLVNGDFSSGLDGWSVEELGSFQFPGAVTVDNGQALMLEGDSFLVTLSQSFVIPECAETLSFEVYFDPGFDLFDDFIPDAWEVQLLDDTFASVVPTWDPLATSFFNVQEDLTTNAALGVTREPLTSDAGLPGYLVTVDLSAVPGGTPVTLFVDLIGGDFDTGSGVRVDNFVLETCNDGSGDGNAVPWTKVDVAIPLTASQPVYWSAATGQPAGGGLPPFSILDPGPPPGEPTADGSGDRVLRGFIVAWAVDAVGREIKWNHLSSSAMVLDYRDGAAWEYAASAFQNVDARLAHGQAGDTPGTLPLDGNEYEQPYGLLLLDFYAPGTVLPIPAGNGVVLEDTSLTLLPVSADLRQEGAGPVTTKASFTVWNMNEFKLTGMDRCVSCWDSAWLSAFAAPNHFLPANLQTDKGKAQIDGLASQLCNVDADPSDGLPLGSDPRDVVSESAALLGVAVKSLAFDGGAAVELAGTNLTGMGAEPAVILADVLGEPPSVRLAALDSGASTVPPRPRLEPHGAEALLRTDSPPATPRGDSSRQVDTRGGISQKGSLLIIPHVELRWDASGNLVRDTFVTLTNDYPADVQVQMYFVNGERPQLPESDRGR